MMNATLGSSPAPTVSAKSSPVEVSTFAFLGTNLAISVVSAQRFSALATTSVARPTATEATHKTESALDGAHSASGHLGLASHGRATDVFGSGCEEFLTQVRNAA
jgi:hypothetical protein